MQKLSPDDQLRWPVNVSKGPTLLTVLLTCLCYVKINDAFGLLPNKIVATVTDNGSNFVKAFREFGVRFHLTDYADDDNDDNDTSDSAADRQETEDVQFVEIHDNAPLSDDGGSSLIELPTHIRCASHTFSLIATTDASVAIKNSPPFSRLNHTVMGKCSALWNHCSRPKSAETVAEMCETTFRTPCATRWNSLYDSIKSLLEKRSVLPNLMLALHLPSFKDVELEFLDEYRQTLAPIAVALDRLQGEKNCYYGDLLPTLFAVKTQLTALQFVNLRHCVPLVNAIVAGFERRFVDFLNLTPDVNMAILATMTHPYFKLRWLPSSLHDQRPRLQKLLITTATSISFPVQDVGEVSLPKADRDTDDDYFGFTAVCSDESANDPVNNTNKSELEVLQFLEDTRRDMTVLNNFPLVKAMFIRFNSVLPSSAPVERLFSFAGIITRPHRRCMADSMFEKLLLLKEN